MDYRIVNIMKSSNLILTILPSYTVQELVANFTDALINLDSDIWKFLAYVGAVVAPLIVIIYRKKNRRNSA